MITFLIPLKPLRHANSESKVIQLLLDTVQSCKAVEEARVMIVCNPCASDSLILLKSNRVDVLCVDDFGLEYDALNPSTLLPFGDEDKGRKLLAGCKKWMANATDEDRLMPLDADDIVSKNIGEAVVPGKSSFFMRGWLKIANRGYLQDSFYWRNGSSHLLTKDYVAAEVRNPVHGPFLFHHYIRRTEKEFACIQQPYVLQRTCHGENVYAKKRRPIKSLLKYIFSSSPIDRSVFVF